MLEKRVWIGENRQTSVFPKFSANECVWKVDDSIYVYFGFGKETYGSSETCAVKDTI